MTKEGTGFLLTKAAGIQACSRAGGCRNPVPSFVIPALLRHSREGGNPVPSPSFLLSSVIPA